MNPPSLFLVSSALKTRFGVFDYPSRVQQTLETCASITKRLSADIILIDGGQEVPDPLEVQYLRQHVVELVSFSQDANVRQLQGIENQHVVKNGIELYMYASYLKSLYETGLYRKYSRIYKISGRYVLNEEFDADFHAGAQGKMVIGLPRPSQFPAELTGGVSQQYMSRLWSCDSAALDYVVWLYHAMFAEFIQVINAGRYIDIEHLLYKFLAKDLILSPSRIGVSGILAPFGFTVRD
jgi:hypothetical protein